MFFFEIVFRFIYSSVWLAAAEGTCVAFSFPVQIYRFLYVSYKIFEPSSEYVFFTDKPENFSVRWMKIPLYAQQYFLDNTYGHLSITQSRFYHGGKK